MHPVCGFLQGLIRDHVNERHGGNISAAADAMGVEYFVLYRLYNKKAKSIAFLPAIQIFQSLGVEDHSLLKDHYPTEYERYGETLKNVPHEDRLRALDFTFSSIARTELYFYIVTKVACTRQDILEHFGQAGLERLDELIDSKVFLETETSELKSLVGDFTNTSLITAKRAGSNIIELINHDAPGNVSRYIASGLNYEGLKAHYYLALEYSDKLVALSNNPEFQGDITVIGTISTGPMGQSADKGKMA